jgi:hypothetical protein
MVCAAHPQVTHNRLPCVPPGLAQLTGLEELHLADNSMQARGAPRAVLWARPVAVVPWPSWGACQAVLADDPNLAWAEEGA